MRRYSLVELELSLEDLDLLIKLTAEASGGYVEGLSTEEQDRSMILHQTLLENKDLLDTDL